MYIAISSISLQTLFVIEGLALNTFDGRDAEMNFVTLEH